MILGLNISHDASAALLLHDGTVVHAVEEERISRIKGHFGLPVDSIRWLLGASPINEPLSVVIGSTAHLTDGLADILLANQQGNPSGRPGRLQEPFPSYRPASKGGSPRRRIQDFIAEVVGTNGTTEVSDFIWERHHDAHLGCALGVSSGKPTLLLSLDSSGDHESGAVAFHSGSGQFETLARFPDTQSLGALYSAVTSRYNFVPNRHEGKITGLAAYGHWSASAEILSKFVHVDEGYPQIAYVKGYRQYLERAKRRLGSAPRTPVSMFEIAEMAEAGACHYEDLAFAVQSVLENAVIELAQFWTRKTGASRLALSGGVFSNVKLNQRLADAPFTSEVLVFPAMGDSGLSIGGVWSHLAKRDSLSIGHLFTSAFLGPTGDESLLAQPNSDPSGITRSLSDESAHVEIVRDLLRGLVVAIHQGALEFGPRALGNRSILIDPRSSDIITKVNARLRRTEFMPFAPIVRDEKFGEYFTTSNVSLQPFEFMTMTCDVVPDKQEEIPAVTHVDGTARPQIVTLNSNPLIYRVLEEFERITGIGCLVNTSFNVHEEPINCTLADSVTALRRGAVDVLYTENARYTVETIA